MRSNTEFPIPAPKLSYCAQVHGTIEQEPKALIKPLVCSYVSESYNVLTAGRLAFAPRGALLPTVSHLLGRRRSKKCRRL
jgi:hypothetical protein